MPGNRKSIRLAGYDYTAEGAYFVTICNFVCTGDACVALASSKSIDFGHIEKGQMILNETGRTICKCWRLLPEHFPSIILDTLVVMPNHVHFVVFIKNDFIRARHASPVQTIRTIRGPKSGSIGAIVGSFKSAVTKHLNKMRGTPGAKVWHRNYYERIIRNEEELTRIREYMLENPLNWGEDRYNPLNTR
ncbi:MAG: transposase [Proteobacteria bacterium]|nr:transposase [Pseudomonadota bacterium]